jgi:hypothetical protein
MTNMSYCWFQNTYHDLAECGEALEENVINNLHGDELRCAVKMIQMCRDIAEQFEGVDLEKLWAENELPKNALVEAGIAAMRKSHSYK